MYTQQEYERDIKILEGAPDGSEFYGVIDPSQPFYSDGDPASCEKIWVENEDGIYELTEADMLCIYAFKIFRDLSDIRALVSMYEQLQGDTNE